MHKGFVLLVVALAFAMPAGSQEQRDVFLQFGHSGGYFARSIQDLGFSPDGKTCLSGGSDGTMRLWDVATGREVRTFLGHTGTVTTVAFSADGTRCCSGSRDGSLVVWDVRTGKKLATCTGHAGGVLEVTFSSDGTSVLSSGEDYTVRLWDAATGQQVRDVRLKQPAYSLSLSPDGTRFLRAGTAPELWDLASGSLLRTYEGHAKSTSVVAFSPDGKQFVSGSYDGTLKLWDAGSGEDLATYPGHAGGAGSAAFSRDGTRVLSTGQDGAVRLWDAETGQELGSWSEPDKALEVVAFSPDGLSFLAAGSEPSFGLWDIAKEAQVRTFAGGVSPVGSLAVSPNGKLLLAGGDSAMHLWDPTTGKLVRSFKGHAGWVNAVAFSPTGTLCASGGRDGKVILWDPITGKAVRTLAGHTSHVNAVTFSKDGKHLLSAGGDWAAKLWDAATGKMVKSFPVGEMVYAAALSPDGTRFALGEDPAGRIVVVASGKEQVIDIGYPILSVAFSANGKQLLYGTWGDSAIYLLDPATGREQATFPGHPGGVSSVAVAADGKRVVSAGYDGTAKVWDLASGNTTAVFTGHQPHHASGCALVPGTPLGVSIGGDDVIRLWNASTGVEVALLVRFSDGEWAALTPGGYFVASAGGAKHLNVRIGTTVTGADAHLKELSRPDLVKAALATVK